MPLIILCGVGIWVTGLIWPDLGLVTRSAIGIAAGLFLAWVNMTFVAPLIFARQRRAHQEMLDDEREDRQ